MSSATYKRSRWSAILPAGIEQVIENTPRKEWKITTPTELDAALEPPLIFQFNITKLQEDSLLHYMRADTLPIVRTFGNQHEKELLHILKNIQKLGLVNAYHPLDIDLLATVAVKHCLRKTDHNFKAEELDVSNTLSKELMRPFINPLTVPP